MLQGFQMTHQAQITTSYKCLEELEASLLELGLSSAKTKQQIFKESFCYKDKNIDVNSSTENKTLEQNSHLENDSKIEKKNKKSADNFEIALKSHPNVDMDSIVLQNYSVKKPKRQSQSLKAYISKFELDFFKLFDIIGQILSGLEYLDSKNLVHGDLNVIRIHLNI